MCPNPIVDNREGGMDHSNAKKLSARSDYFDREAAGFFRREIASAGEKYCRTITRETEISILGSTVDSGETFQAE